MIKRVALLSFLLFFSVLFTLGGLTCTSWAQTQPQNAKTQQAVQAPAGKFIQDLGSQAIAIMADKSLTQDQRANHYSALLHDAFDLPTIGHFVLGRAWATATPQQQQDFMKLFEALVIKMYGDRLSFYSGEGFQVTAVRQEDEKNSIVSSQVTHPDGAAPTSIDWRVRQNGDKMSIVDVSVEGVSQSVTQRDEYTSIIQRNGGNINPLLDLMRQQLQSATNSQ